MKRVSMEMDLRTGAVWMLAPDGRRFALEDWDEAAAAGAVTDGPREITASENLLGPAAWDDDDEGAPDPECPDDVRALLEELAHDCPDCRAARAQGEQPVFSWTEGIDPPLDVLVSSARRAARDDARSADPTWWHGKRRRRFRGKR